MTGLITGNKTASMAERGPDFYASPYAALPPLLVAEARRLPRTIWEPSCGNGALVLPLRNRGFKVLASDLHDWGCPDAHPHMDFFSARVTEIADLIPDDGQFGIVTNPPWGPSRNTSSGPSDWPHTWRSCCASPSSKARAG